MKKNIKKKGFTLIELIVVIAILGILAAVLIPRFAGFQDKAHRTQIVTDAKQIATAADSMIAESSTGDLTGKTNTQVLTLAGVTLKAGDSLSLDVDSVTGKLAGGFTLTETLGGKTYTATRTAAGGAATVSP